MGFFSFYTQDTNKSIANRHSNRPTFKVYMTDNKGNKWEEGFYGGYGEFSGKDYFELMAEMNGLKTRSEGIDLFYSSQECLYPNLSEDQNWTWRNEAPQQCPDQGFFYDEFDDN